MIICLTERAQQMCIICTNDSSLTSLKQFLNFTQQNSVKHINISCKVTSGFKYIKVHFISLVSNISAQNSSFNNITKNIQSKAISIIHFMSYFA